MCVLGGGGGGINHESDRTAQDYRLGRTVVGEGINHESDGTSSSRLQTRAVYWGGGGGGEIQSVGGTWNQTTLRGN